MALLPLRERGHELGRAREALLQALSAGEGRVLVLTGEPGIGKTAVLDAIAREALGLGFAVGAGKADEGNQVAPGAPLLLALRSGPSPLLDEDGFRSLAPLYDKTLWLVDQIAELLEVRAQREPVLISLDDLQWADQLSQFGVRALASRLIGSPVVWALSARTSPTPFLTDPEAFRLLAGAQVERLPLAPLSEAGVLGLATELLGAAPVGVPADTLTQVGGNPFLVIELCRGLTEEADAGRDGSAIPSSLAAALQARLASLTSGCLALVEAAAVWGVPLPLRVARELVGAPAADVRRDAQLAAASGLLRLGADGVAFRHDLLRQFVHDELAETRRMALHGASAGLLLSSGGSAAMAVPHARAMAAHGDPTGVELLRRAAREYRSVTPVTAAALMREAFAASPVGSATWQEVGEECAEFLASAQRGTEITVVVDALLAQPHSAEFEARLQVLTARALWLVGDVDDMARRSRRALSHSGTSRPLRSQLLAVQALALSRLGPMEAAETAAQEALIVGRALGDVATTTLALQALGEVAKNEGRHLAAHAHFHELRTLAGPAHLAEEIAALQFIDCFDEAEVLLADAEAEVRAESSPSLPSLACARLWQDFKRAHFDAAATDAQTLIRVGDESGTSVYRLDAHVVLSTIAVVHGDLATAETLIGRAEEEAATADAVQVPGLMLGRARIAAARGDVDAGVQILRRLVGAADDTSHTYWPRMLDQLRLYAGLAVAGGHRRLAEEAVELAADAAGNNPGVDSLAGVALQVRGFVRRDAAALERAVDYLRRAPRPMMLASALADHGEALARAGRGHAGVVQLEEALSLYLRLDAHLAAAQLRRTLVAAGARSGRALARPPRPRFGWASLTESELRVAELVSAGQTNRTVARSLGVSTSTVGTHLRSVFAKLDVQSRVQLANASRDRDESMSSGRRAGLALGGTT